MNFFSSADAQIQDPHVDGNVASSPQQIQSIVAAANLPSGNAIVDDQQVKVTDSDVVASVLIPAQPSIVPASVPAPLPAQIPIVPAPSPTVLPLQVLVAPTLSVQIPLAPLNSAPAPAQVPTPPAPNTTSSSNSMVSVADKADNELKPSASSEHMAETNDKKNARDNSIDGDSNVKSISQTTVTNTDLGLAKAQILSNSGAVGSENAQNVVSQYVAQKDSISTGDTSSAADSKNVQSTQKVDTPVVTDVGQPVPVIATPMGTFPTSTVWFPSKPAIEDGSSATKDAAQKMERLIR